MKDLEILDELKPLIAKELRKNVEKGSISPPEMDAINKAVCALEKIAKIEQINEEMNELKDNHSSAFYNIRNYPQQYPPMSYEHNDWSGERGRSMHTGRFVSRDGYSGHSVNDRMVEQLEKMMDTTTSDFERQQILDKIKMIRNSPDRIG